MKNQPELFRLAFDPTKEKNKTENITNVIILEI